MEVCDGSDRRVQGAAGGIRPALTTFLFAAVMGILTVNVRQDSLWTMIFVDCDL